MGKMSRLDVEKILGEIELRGIMSTRKFRLTKKGDGFNLQVVYDEPDIVTGAVTEQHSRKWYVSPWMTVSEVVRTAQKALKCSMEHVVDEHFLFRGVRVFSPHYDVEQLAQLGDGVRMDARTGSSQPPQKLQEASGTCVCCGAPTKQKAYVATYGDPWKAGDFVCENCYEDEHPAVV